LVAVFLDVAARARVNEDEILDAVFIAAIIGQTKVLASSPLCLCAFVVEFFLKE
jgi:hypothetical protein